MDAARLVQRSLRHYARRHIPVALGVMTATATLTGALLVGDSMRGSLRGMALSRLGPVEYAMVAPRFFREALASELMLTETSAASVPRAPLIVASVGARNARTAVRINRVNLYGVDERFWSMGARAIRPEESASGIVLNQALADDLGVRVGDDVLINLAKAHSAPVDTLLGRRDEMTLQLRRTVSAVLPRGGMAELSLSPGQQAPRNAYIPLRDLQAALKQPDRANAILLGDLSGKAGNPQGELASAVRRAFRLEDAGLRIRTDLPARAMVVESDRTLIEPAAEDCIVRAALGIGSPTRVLAYLVNDTSIDREPARGGTASSGVPYSVGCAIENCEGLALMDGAAAPGLADDEILLNEWAAGDLGARPGDRIRLTYYVSRPGGRLDTRHAVLSLKGVVRMTGLGADASLTPSYEGITDAKRMGDWNPPFPLDLKRIRPKDEQYWDRYKAIPKLFVSLQTGLRLWQEADSRHGRLTSIRVTPPAGSDLEGARVSYAGKLRAALNPDDFGLTFRPVREEALKAAEGNTDFGMLFVSFSFFLIISAAMLVALLFRLGMERRARDVGLLLAVGLAPRPIARILFREGLLVAGAAVLAGLPVAVGYAWLMLTGLRTWWAQPAFSPQLELHVSPSTLAVGAVAGLLVAAMSMGWALRGLTRLAPRTLLSGATQVRGLRPSARGRTIAFAIAAVSSIAGLVAFAYSISRTSQPSAAAFFLAGASFLIAALAVVFRALTRDAGARPIVPGRSAALRLALRHAGLNRGRSLLTAGLIASAAFVIVSVGANRHHVGAADLGPRGGTGGYQLIGEVVVPLGYDPAQPALRHLLNLSDDTIETLRGSTIMSLRARPGDDTSCLNLFQARNPRILGVSREFIERGGFTFSGSLAATPEEKANPWRLLDRTFPDGAIPCIGDANSIVWLLHLGLGRDFVTQDEGGRPIRMRIVGMLSGSVLQGELIIAESRFRSVFPSIGGYGVLLIDTPLSKAAATRQKLEQDLSDYGLDLRPTAQRLEEYMAVENTYLSAFTTLGGLGLLLGTLGLAAVMLRNVEERRGELSLLLALGWRPALVSRMVFVEHAALLLAGLAAGTLPAMVAVAPHVLSAKPPAPWSTLGWNLAGILTIGLLTLVMALRSALRTPLMPALRQE